MATFSITLALLGHGEPYPEQPAETTGWKSSIGSADWTIVRATHSISNTGFTRHLAW
ncbi:hypothetical protein LG200_06310 [Methylobacillus caricis]|uniref:hypothetical protein n=1 Tax=Methylobacillus caricis TaxID=1971611 RepID=UPI001D001175|nr:hypothetical protein [Methylobacillus caricis]MCB5187618.1 hypothetical protein [Methylobacillus caricis]